MASGTRDRLEAAKGRIGAFGPAGPGPGPGPMKGFAEVFRSATADSRVTAQKELVAFGIAVVEECEDRILYHADGARPHGAEDADLTQTLEVAVEMGGGPALTYAGRAREIFRDL